MIRRIVYAAALTTMIVTWQIVCPLTAQAMIVARRIIGAMSSNAAIISSRVIGTLRRETAVVSGGIGEDTASRGGIRGRAEHWIACTGGENH